MIKKITNIYDYSDYRLLLADDFMARSANNYSYSLRAYARDLSLSPGFVSDVLRGNKDLSPAKGRQVFALLQYENEELDYIEKLIIFKSSPHEAARQDAYQYIQSRLNRIKFESDDSKDLIIQSFAHFVIYGINRKLNELTDILNFAARLNISEEEAKKILADFVQHQYILESGGRYQVNDAKLTLTNHQLLLSFLTQFTNQISCLMEKGGGLKPPDHVAHGIILGLNEQSYELAIEAHKHFIKSMDRIANQSTHVDRFIFLSDFMMTMKTS